MDYSCSQCGVSVNFNKQGTFFVKQIQLSEAQTISRSFYQSDNSAALNYTNLQDIEEAAKKIYARGYHHVNCGVAHQGGTASFMDIQLFLERIQNRETIEFIQNGKFVSHLQPILKVDSGDVYAYESLLRSNDPSKSISPFELFKVANTTGFHSLLDQRAREEAIKAKKMHIQHGIKSFINFLPSTIYNPEYCLKHTFNIVKKYDIDPEDLVFEVVETEKITDVDHLKSVFNTYKREGIKVALDDVGAGFSTIDMLKLLEPDYVKIDRSFISFCDTSAEKQDFLKEVRETSQNLGIKVLAEGIERQEELEICQKLGLDLCQGYLFGKPSESAQLPAVTEAFVS
ncbi:EAL domain-containing protein [Jeotgalibacillus sp. ET6]|uniref:EAL domain-containing protein n=1 Tax=Jeotgalibacillus sp. ET6 TaxID=3037260 RepID=UPI002418AF8A|nr:EAL domain-containing protein [Jeotgalibacillus sp. ET6]MDG5473068.1 EAL domain-containing protein [Jeotgalibacillus sp. ET6]